MTPSSKSREVLLESANSFKDAASSIDNGIKEWAATLPKSRDSTVEAAAKETELLYDVGGKLPRQNVQHGRYMVPRLDTNPCNNRMRRALIIHCQRIHGCHALRD
jgi:hypothetical protein|mmetsp:Transcript_3073/g.5674  ORF Transcript_3073/g.5674 Transcript_3073/m.5674 type:complete len:105 (+) Transcript_3073:1289-1603(+)